MVGLAASPTFGYRGPRPELTFQGVFSDVADGEGKFQSANAGGFDNLTRDQLDRWQKPVS
jgi:hypothetical protein